MSEKKNYPRLLITFLRTGLTAIATEITTNFSGFTKRRQPLVWLLAILIGVAVALAAIAFRVGIGLFQLVWLGTASEAVVTAATGLPPLVILAAPALGGLVVGILLHAIQPKQRTSSVADVMEARVRGGGGLPFWPGISSAFLTAMSLGMGASAGREGPMVHLGGTIGAALCRSFKLPVEARRVLLACGVASAVSASFNAPIAGVLFAHEVVLGHYALSAIVPISISAVTGTLLSRLWFGNVAAFVIPGHQITSYWEFPAFALLGMTCAAVAIIFQFALIGTDWIVRHTNLPIWSQPALGGVGVGAIAVLYPEVLGVGYETTDAALKNNLPLMLMLTLLVAKTAATAISLGTRFGGGIFSPSLYLGAMTGGAFGLIAANVFPDLASSEGLYAILGMGAVAAAVLGAPFSTTMIVFELTGGYALSIALLVTVSIATGLTLAFHGRSYFHWQLEMRGLFIQEGPHRTVSATTRVSDFMEPVKEGEEAGLLEADAIVLKPADTLETALQAFDKSGNPRLPVVDPRAPQTPIAWASHVRALSNFNKALIAASEEEHR
jgi:CIC family chloride channel protein